MILANTAANRSLVRAMAKAIDGEVGYRAFVDWHWNCGEDIRLEIGTVDILHCPYVVSSWMTSEGNVEIKLRMLKLDCWTREVTDWRDWLSRLDGLVEKLNSLHEKGVA